MYTHTYIELPTNKVNGNTEAQLFHSSNHHKWRQYQILGSKTVQIVKKGQQKTAEKAKRPVNNLWKQLSLYFLLSYRRITNLSGV